MKNYGITTVGKHTVVCLVLNASSIDVKYLGERFPDLLITEYVPNDSYTRKRYEPRVRIEGCVLNKDDFYAHYEFAKVSMGLREMQQRYDSALKNVEFAEMEYTQKGTIDGKEVLIDTSVLYLEPESGYEDKTEEAYLAYCAVMECSDEEFLDQIAEWKADGSYDKLLNHLSTFDVIELMDRYLSLRNENL